MPNDTPKPPMTTGEVRSLIRDLQDYARILEILGPQATWVEQGGRSYLRIPVPAAVDSNY